MLDFFISEMAVSDNHGGGITLQRVLGTDLDSIPLYLYLATSAIDQPAVNRLSRRGINFIPFFERRSVRDCVGHRVGQWLSERHNLRWFHAACAARLIDFRFRNTKRNLTGLVCPQGSASLYAIEALFSLRKTSYISWIMDDHLLRWSGTEWFYPKGIEALMGRHLRSAACVFVISEKMRTFYKSRFGVDSHVLMPPAEMSDFPEDSQINFGENRVCRIGYFGNLAPWATDAINRLVPHLERLDVQLDIYGPAQQPSGLFSEFKRVRLGGSLDSNILATIMRGYDAVLLPVSFRSSERNMTEMNVATRMAGCLASGTVTLAIGPRYSAMIDYIDRNGAGIVVDDPNFSNFKTAIHLIRNGPTRMRLLEAARAAFQRDLSVSAAQAIWALGFCCS
jgi:glycosyltransferase involved in cell wall biosynthesis